MQDDEPLKDAELRETRTEFHTALAEDVRVNVATVEARDAP